MKDHKITGLTPTERTKLKLALVSAMQWEESLIDAHKHCKDPESEKYKNECRKNISEYSKLKERL